MKTKHKTTETAHQRNVSLAATALKAFPNNLKRAGEQLEKAVWTDFELALDATKWAHKESIRRLLNEARATVSAGHSDGDARMATASTGGGQSKLDIHRKPAAPTTIPDGKASDPTLKGQGHSAKPSGNIQAAVEMRSKVARLTIMDTLRTPLGQPYAQANYNDLKCAFAAIPHKQGQLVFHQRLIERLMPQMELGDPRVTVKERFTEEEFLGFKNAAENVNYHPEKDNE